MEFKKFMTKWIFIISFLPMVLFADISVNNNTDANITAKLIFMCSTMIGDNGVLKPHQSLNIDQHDIDQYCQANCKLDVFASSDCSGRSIATVTASNHKGISKVENHNIDGYYLAGSGNAISINKNSGFSRLFHQLF